MSSLATAILVFTSCSAARVGVMGKTRRAASIANWACNCAKKTPKRRVKAKRAMIADRPHDRDLGDGLCPGKLTMGYKLRVLTIIDTVFRFPPVLAPRFVFRGTDVVEVLERACNELGDSRRRSGSIKAANSCRAILICGPTSAVTLDFSRPGTPTDYAFIEAFNGRFRTEYLNARWFPSLEAAKSGATA